MPGEENGSQPEQRPEGQDSAALAAELAETTPVSRIHPEITEPIQQPVVRENSVSETDRLFNASQGEVAKEMSGLAPDAFDAKPDAVVERQAPVSSADRQVRKSLQARREELDRL